MLEVAGKYTQLGPSPPLFPKTDMYLEEYKGKVVDPDPHRFAGYRYRDGSRCDLYR
jgi:hypothetical protein